MIGSDVGELGDKEIEAETVARWGKRLGSYFAAAPAVEAEFVPVENLRVSGTVSAAYHDISAIAGLEDRRRGAFDSLSIDLRYRLIERARAGFGQMRSRTGAVSIRRAASRSTATASILRSCSTKSSFPTGCSPLSI
jgi:hypothetical protein